MSAPTRRRSLGVLAAAALLSAWGAAARAPEPPAVLATIDRYVREFFWDPTFKGADWAAAVERARRELERATTEADRDAAYDRLLAALQDSHTLRVPKGRLPERDWGTAGLRIGRDGGGYAVKGLIPGGPAQRAGLRLGDAILSADGRRYRRERVNFRELHLRFEGRPGSVLELTYRPAAGGSERAARLTRTLEEPGETLVWKSARVIRRDGKAYGYARLWGMSAETALAVVDLLLDREEIERVRPELSGWSGIQGFLLDARGNSGGYDPNILPTFLRGRWSAGDYWTRTRRGRRHVPPAWKPIPVALLVNSGTASAGEGLALKFRAHRIGPIVGEETAGMVSGGGAAYGLPDGSSLWITQRAIEDENGKPWEGRGVPPDVAVADRPAAAPGREEAIVEAALDAIARRP